MGGEGKVGVSDKLLCLQEQPEALMTEQGTTTGAVENEDDRTGIAKSGLESAWPGGNALDGHRIDFN